MNSKVFTRTILFIAIFAFTAVQAQAQILPEFGVKGGLNLSTTTNTDDVAFKPGFVAGAFIKINVPVSPISVQPEVLFAQYGAKAADGGEESQQLDYIQVPVLLKVGFSPPLSLAKPYVYAGPYAGFNTRAEAETDDGNFDISDAVSDTDYGIAGGIGLDVMSFNIDLRYTAGLTNIFEDADAKNNALSLTLGIAF
ncbi:MAG: porin family protein [Balneolaceae bacterium]